MPPAATKSKWLKCILRKKVKVKVIDLGVSWKGFFSRIYMPNMKHLSFMVQKLLRRVVNIATPPRFKRLTNTFGEHLKFINKIPKMDENVWRTFLIYQQDSKDG